MTTATIGLLAYGLRTSPIMGDANVALLAAGAYTSMSWDLQMQHAHAGCHISAFCRNPLHPGPCKGWKGHLGLVSPGALHALEKIRHEQLEEKRKIKVKALQDAGKAIPKHLATPIVYDPAKNKHLNGDLTTPGLGVPTKGLTPEAAKENLAKIPTKAQVGAKLDAKHAAEAAAAVPKPTTNPVYTTIAKAGLKDGDKVFLHGKGKATGEPQLVTVRKIGGPGGGKTVGGGKAQGFQFEDAHGNLVTHPHQEGVSDAPMAGGVASKWLLSPAPGKSFPDTPAQTVAKNIADAKAKGSIPTPDVPAAKHEAQATALGKFFNQVTGTTHTPESQQKFQELAAEHHAAGKQLVPDDKVKAGADKIAAKVYPVGGNAALMHQGDLEQALIKDIHDGVNEGKPTPVLDAVKEAGVGLGQGKPGAAQALADAVHAKLGISGHDDTPAKAEPVALSAPAEHTPEHIQSQIAKAYKKTLKQNGKSDEEWAQLADIHKNLEDKSIPKSKIDQELTKLSVHKNVNVLPESNQKAISPEQAAAAVSIGNQKKHIINFTNGHADKLAAGPSAHDAASPPTGPPTPSTLAPPPEPSSWIIAEHKNNLAGVTVGTSLPFHSLETVENIEPHEYQALDPKSKQKVKDILDHLQGLGSDKPGVAKEATAIKDKLGIAHNLVETDAVGVPSTLGHAPHVKEAIDLANGFKASTATKKLEAFKKLSPSELAALDPNTKKLMVSHLNGMQTKFVAPKKKAEVLDVLHKVEVAQGGGAGAGGMSEEDAYKAAVIAHNKKIVADAAQGTAAAYAHGVITTPPGTEGFESVNQVFEGMHQTMDPGGPDEAFGKLGAVHAEHMLKQVGLPHDTGLGAAALPHLSKELGDAFQGGAKATPLADALHNSTSGNIKPFVDAVKKHPALAHVAVSGPKKSGAEVVESLAAHAGYPAVDGSIAKVHQKNVDDLGQDQYHSILAELFSSSKTASAMSGLHLGPAYETKIQAQLPELASMQDEYKQALDNGNSEPSGLSGKLDKIVADTNASADELVSKNGWVPDGVTAKEYKASLFIFKVKAALESNPGAGGSSTHTSPASVPAPSAPNVTPAAPYTAPTPSATTKTAKGTILLKHAQALKVVKIMKSFPEGQYLESPEPKIWDNLVAISAHEGVSPMQALTTLDDQNAKKLGVTNANLLEKKVRAWLATGDGKEYADANHTPKSALLDHVKKVDAGHTDFTNKTGITLPPGEKVQKLGGPGEHDESKPGSAFIKNDTDTAAAEQDKFKTENGIKFTATQKAALKEYVQGSGSINGWLRDEHTPSQESIDNAIHLQSMMLPTTRDQLLLRGTGWTQFPPEARSFEGLQALIGETLEEPAFLSASVAKSSSGFGGAVKMHIQAPKGTMGVFTKDAQFPNGVVPSFLGSEAELLLAAKTELKVLKVWKEGGQVQVLMRVVS